MTALLAAKIGQSLVVELEPDILANGPGVLTNARQNADTSRVAIGARPFLLLEKDMLYPRWLCAPMFSHGYEGFDLDPNLQIGPTPRWGKSPCFYNKFQFWIIPSPCILAASINDRGYSGNRHSYAVARPDVIAKIAEHWLDSDAAYSPPVSN